MRAGCRRAPRRGTASAAGRVPAARARSSVLQIPMQELDRHRSLADGGRNPLDGVGTHVASREHAGDAGLEVVGIAVERPAPWSLPVAQQVRSGEDEASRVTRDHAFEPFGARLGADEDEEVAGPNRLLRTGLVVAEGEPLEVAGPVRLDDLG